MYIPAQRTFLFLQRHQTLLLWPFGHPLVLLQLPQPSLLERYIHLQAAPKKGNKTKLNITTAHQKCSSSKNKQQQ
jgi:hypothetical protein